MQLVLVGLAKKIIKATDLSTKNTLQKRLYDRFNVKMWYLMFGTYRVTHPQESAAGVLFKVQIVPPVVLDHHFWLELPVVRQIIWIGWTWREIHWKSSIPNASYGGYFFFNHLYCGWISACFFSLGYFMVFFFYIDTNWNCYILRTTCFIELKFPRQVDRSIKISAKCFRSLQFWRIMDFTQNVYVHTDSCNFWSYQGKRGARRGRYRPMISREMAGKKSCCNSDDRTKGQKSNCLEANVLPRDA